MRFDALNIFSSMILTVPPGSCFAFIFESGKVNGLGMVPWGLEGGRSSAGGGTGEQAHGLVRGVLCSR